MSRDFFQIHKKILIKMIILNNAVSVCTGEREWNGEIKKQKEEKKNLIIIIQIYESITILWNKADK